MKECMENKVMQEDIESLVNSDLPVQRLEGRTVLVTGATGLIGSQMVYLLACYNRMRSLNVRIIAMVRNREKAKKLFSHLIDRGDVTLFIADVNETLTLDSPVDYIIHGASATSSKYFVSHPVETIHTAIDGTANILKLAAQKQVKSMIYLSSLEVYGTPQPDQEKIREADYGYIEPLNVRSSYSEGKRMVECLCASYAKEYEVPVKIARLSQTFGPGVTYEDGRVFAEFARCALEQKNIVLHTQGRTVRSYCYTKDALSALLYILLHGKTGEAYNVTNMDTAISIKDMADMVCETIGNGKIKTVIDIPEDVSAFGYNPEMIIRLDSSRLMELGWTATTGIEEMFVRLADGFVR